VRRLWLIGEMDKCERVKAKSRALKRGSRIAFLVREEEDSG